MLLPLLLAAAPVTHYVITPKLEQERLEVEVRLEGPRGDRLCLDMGRADTAISGLRQVSPGCFAIPAQGPVRYQVSLAALRRVRDDPDFAAHLGPAWLFQDCAMLLHPAPLAPDAVLRVRFVLPEGVSVATPWAEEKDGAFTFSGAQHDAGAYVALGKLRTLPLLQLDGFSARITLVDAPRKASDAQLRGWVERALKALGAFYKGSPTRGVRPLHLVLAGLPGSSDAGVFGSVLRRGEPSVMLLFGAQATTGFDSDWVAVHELFHLGNPPTEGRYPWFVEGFTTYYTELLRVRAGMLTEAQALGTLASSLREYCQPEGGRSLEAVSADLGRTHQWMRVYWGGACLALRADVAIRQRSGGKRSLDTLLRTLRDGPPLDEAGVVKALDEAVGQPLASTHLKETRALPIEPLLGALGVGPVVGELAKLDDKAPLAGLRKSLISGP